ncbi:melanoma-associated antigen 10 [Ictidomys tridecemlineatus]|nr:melanoma-associated antigen 10-like isoform X2 [Ictidomys tridecemlineatus]XP_040142269.1 melanoma-associated antigen 10-like isoform X2 [Ictidomys tridecemlineatus]XP_040142273.1 melanoma-associated antigen 10-like isoform X2 [Ictidomys tridecemlineatus]XP_040142278.1 melanoma-associated antigen 10-like isoform X2 [Ictidomys tridecemlineatus]XP_040142285.1 melanoma-associated antigen 10-like isoform X2 [Ictidomys tridecemlineatus]XP_040142289.1 melanoma-associated antigen 10-like isoform X
MPRFPKRPRLTLEQDFQNPFDIQDLIIAQAPTAEKEGDTSSSSSSSLNLSYPSSSPPSPSSSSSSASSSSSLILDTPEEEEPVAAMCNSPQSSPKTTPPSTPQSSPRTSPNTQSSHSSLTSWNKLDEEFSSQEESSSTFQSSTDTEFLPRDPLEEKVTDLVHILILKYRLKEPITKVEMLRVVTKEYKHQFPVIFKKATKCLEVIFGIDVKETDTASHLYALVNSLNLTYDEILTNDQSMPKNGFLIIILGVIFIEGNCASEENIWEFLNMMGVYDGKEHFIYGEPRKFITRDLVQENYLEYRRVPNSDPPYYEFLWGPRAKAETTKMKVLEFLAKVKGSDPISFSSWYEEALREEEERTQDRIGPVDDSTALFIAQHWSAASPAPSEE